MEVSYVKAMLCYSAWKGVGRRETTWREENIDATKRGKNRRLSWRCGYKVERERNCGEGRSLIELQQKQTRGDLEAPNDSVEMHRLCLEMALKVIGNARLLLSAAAIKS